MEKYIKVYPFSVTRMIEEGKQVFMLDRKRADIYTVNNMRVEEFLQVMNTKDEEGRYDFWCIEVVADGC
jgi:hypothetical protein